MPERIAGVGEGMCHRVSRGVDAKTVENLDKRQIHVYIIVEIGIIGHGFGDIVRIAPWDLHFIADLDSLIFEFGGSAVGHTYCLTGPAALDFIQQFSLCHRDCPRHLGCGCFVGSSGGSRDCEGCGAYQSCGSYDAPQIMFHAN